MQFAVARRYARALFQLSREKGVISEVCAELGRVAGLIEDQAIARVLTTAATGARQRREVVATIAKQMGLSKLVWSFLALLADHRRLAALPEISLLFGAMEDRDAGRTRARFISATPLNQGVVEEVKKVLQRKTGKDVVASVEVAPELLAGLVVHVEGRVYDATVRRQLERLERAMGEE